MSKIAPAADQVTMKEMTLVGDRDNLQSDIVGKGCCQLEITQRE